MSGLQIIITQAGRAALPSPDNTGTRAVRISHVGLTATAFAPSSEMTTLPGEHRRLATVAGEAVAPDTLHITVEDSSASTYTVRGFGLYLDDGTLFALYGQPEAIAEKSPNAMLLLAADVVFADIDATRLEFGETRWLNPPATTERQGVVELATDQEAATGEDGIRAITARALKWALDRRFGVGAPSEFVKGLLAAAHAAAFRLALGLGNVATRNEGAGNGLDADLLDGQHGAYYRAWENLTGVPASFPPAAHGHAWSQISGIPSFATRWPTWAEVSGKPATMPPSAHGHSASDITSGVFVDSRIPNLPMSKIIGLSDELSAKLPLNGAADLTGTKAFRHTGAAPIRVVRTNSDANSSIQYETTGGSLWAGHAASGMWAVGDSADLTVAANRILSVSRTTIQYLGGVIWHAGNFDPNSRAPASHTHSAYDIQSGQLHQNRIPLLSQSKVEGLETALAGKAPITSPSFTGHVRTTGYVYANGNRFYGGSAGDLCFVGDGAHGIVWRPRGWTAAGQAYLDNNGNFTIAGNYDRGSSRTIKDVLDTCPYGLREVEILEPVLYVYHRDYNPDGRQRLGFVAEDAELLFPEVVGRSAEGIPTMDYSALVPVLWRAVQQLSARVRELQADDA